MKATVRLKGEMFSSRLLFRIFDNILFSESAYVRSIVSLNEIPVARVL